MADPACDNCGDGKGWHRIPQYAGTSMEWAACADCNDDGVKPKPEACEACGETEPFCWCASGFRPVFIDLIGPKESA